MHDTLRHMRREQGLSIIEVIVACVVLLVVGAALSGLFVDTVKTQSKLSLNERRMAVAEGVFERLKSESGWMAAGAGNCQSMPTGNVNITCNSAWLSANFQASALANQSGTTAPVTFQTNIRIVGIDDAFDGQRQSDRDGTRPDYYAARIQVRRDANEEWFTLNGTIDPPGRVTTGALKVIVCRVSRQYDERIPIAGCPNNRPDSLLAFPAGSPFGGNTNVQQDWEAALDRGRNGGNWNMVSFNINPANGVQLSIEQYPGPSGVQRDAVPPGWNGPGGCSATANRKRVTCSVNGAGAPLNVTGLIPGRYSVSVTGVPNGYVIWPLHSIPSDNTAIVEKGRSSSVLQVIRPVDRAFYDVDLWNCDHSEVQSWGTGPCENNAKPSGMAGFLAPAPSSRGHWSNYASVGPNAQRIRFTNLVPGLYSARIVTQGKSSLLLHQGPAANGADLKFLWIDPVANGVGGGDAPNSGTASWTRHWCNYARRVSFLAGVGLGPGGGNVPHTHYTYTQVTNADGTTSWVVSGSYIHQHYYYPATACQSGSNPPPPGGGSGGA